MATDDSNEQELRERVAELEERIDDLTTAGEVAVDAQGREWTLADLMNIGLTRRQALGTLAAMAGSGLTLWAAIRESTGTAKAVGTSEVGQFGEPGRPIDGRIEDLYDTNDNPVLEFQGDGSIKSVSTVNQTVTGSFSGNGLNQSSDPQNPTRWITHGSGAQSVQRSEVGQDITADGTAQVLVDVDGHWNGLLLVTGYTSSDNWFADLVIQAGATQLSTLGSETRGSPAARSYDWDGSNDVSVTISDEGATYTVNTTHIGSSLL